MIQRNFTFICDVNGSQERYDGVAVTDMDNHVHIPLRPLMDHLKLDWMTMYNRAKEKCSPTTHKLPGKRGVRDTFCLIDNDMQAILDSLDLTRIKDVQKSHLIGRYVTGFVNQVVTQCVTKSEPVQESTEIRIDHALSAKDWFLSDLSRLALTGRLSPSAVQIGGTTDFPVLVEVRQMFKLPRNADPNHPFYANYLRMAAKPPEIIPITGPKVETLPIDRDETYRPTVFRYKPGDLFADGLGRPRQIMTLRELALEQPEHDLVRRPELDLYRWINVEVDGKLQRQPNPNYKKPIKPYWE